MNLQLNIPKKLIAVIALSLWSYAAIASSSSQREISKESFINCTFSAPQSQTTHFSIKTLGDGNEDACAIKLNPIGFAPAGGMHLGILIAASRDIDENADSAGFTKNRNGSWVFTGYPFLKIEPIKYLMLKTSIHHKSNDITLIGREHQSGYIAQGGPLQVNGISVFRITPSYYLSAQLGFEPSVPDATQAAVESELVKIIESIKINAPATTATSSPSH